MTACFGCDADPSVEDGWKDEEAVQFEGCLRAWELDDEAEML